jgi:hypothetical protein
VNFWALPESLPARLHARLPARHRGSPRETPQESTGDSGREIVFPHKKTLCIQFSIWTIYKFLRTIYKMVQNYI